MLVRSPAMPVKTHVAAPASTNFQRLTANPARKWLAIFCACARPVGIGLGAVCVWSRGPQRTKTMDCPVGWLVACLVVYKVTKKTPP